MSLARPKNTGVSAIDRFKVWKVLGKGAQGIVYLAEDPDRVREVAIKTLLRSGASTESLVREARNTSRLQHPHMATDYDIGEYEGTPYIVYEYIEGRFVASGHCANTKSDFVAGCGLDGANSRRNGLRARGGHHSSRP